MSLCDTSYNGHISTIHTEYYLGFLKAWLGYPNLCEYKIDKYVH